MITARRHQMPNGGLIHPEAMNAAVNRRTRTARSCGRSGIGTDRPRGDRFQNRLGVPHLYQIGSQTKARYIVLRALVDRCERAGPPVTSAFAPIAVIVVDPTLRD